MKKRHPSRGRAARRVLTGAVLGAGVLFGLSQSASAAVTASFTNGVLTVVGDNLDNNIEISRNAAGTLLVNGGAVQVGGGTATVANTFVIQVFGQGGNDTITFNEAFGALPRTNSFGGVGNDTITGGSGGDLLFGQSGNDTLLGRNGFDQLFGGADNDTLTGGNDDDQVFGESGDDRMVWNPGDDTDLNEGGAGSDIVEVNGGSGAEVFAATANGTRVRFDRLDPAPFAIDIGTSENLVLNANGGNDRFSTTGDLAPLIKISADGGTGDDTLLGSTGADLLLGGADNDFVDGQQGSDLARLGAGDDVFQWDPGDGSDSVEGQENTDTMLFNGSGGSEIFEATANGPRLRFTRNLGNIVMDTDDVEVIDLNALGNTDALTVNDLTGTDVVEINTDLAGAIGGTAGDAAADVITVNGTNGDDNIDVAGAGSSVSVLGLHTRVNIANTEGANDSLVINTLGGNDAVTSTTLPAGVIKLTVDGGAGDDTMFGSQGADLLRGGEHNDFIFGDNGNDRAEMGAGDDVFQWDPGDGNDTLEGQEGADSMLFVGANINEDVSVSANGGRVVVFRNIATVTMDLDDVETIDFRALGGNDNVAVGDLSGTDLTRIDTDLSGPNGGGDGAADSVTVNGTNLADVFGAAGDAGGVQAFGLQAVVNIFSPEQANDRLALNGLDGDDVIDATSLEADAMQLTLSGGRGQDLFLGGEGNDAVNGGDGDDVAVMGAGDDTFAWNPGDDNDTLEGQAGTDRMLFNGANVDEEITVSATADQRVTFFRNVAAVQMDLDDVEVVDFRAFGGADKVTVNDLRGTDVVEVDTDLTEAANLAGADSVIVQGTSGDDVALVAGDASGVAAFGLAAQVNIIGSQADNDRLTMNLLAGDDVMDASGLAVGGIQLTADGGDDDDVLIGSDGDDVLTGGAGDDVLIGGPGIDVIDGGADDDVEIQLVADGDRVSSATTADVSWLAEHVRIVDGITQVDVGGKAHLLPSADLSQLIEVAPTS